MPRALTRPAAPRPSPPLRHELTRLVAGATVGLIALGAFATWRIWEQGDRDERRPADAIVVLGAAQYDGRPSPVFRARLDHAVGLHHEGIAPYLVVTGGKQKGDRWTEAEAARRYAIEHGVDPAAILVENEGRTTIESLRSVGDLFRERGIKRAVFVSDRAHMLRVLRIARDQGIVPYGSPTTTSPTDTVLERRLEATVHELGALAVYFVTGDQPSRADPEEDREGAEDGGDAGSDDDDGEDDDGEDDDGEDAEDDG